MLVDSPRLRPGDREQWALDEAADLLRARQWSRRLDSLAASAQATIRRALSGGPAYLSVSWGKDSTVVLDLAHEVAPDLLVVHLRQGSLQNPDCDLVRDEALSRWALRYVEIECPDGQEVEYTWEHWHAQCREAYRYGRRIMGIRAEESASRRLSARVHGLLTGATCRPILHWTIEDVWAWIARRDLPVCPVYSMTCGGAIDRSSLRVDGLLDGAEGPGTGLGRKEWERVYYGSRLGAVSSSSS